LLIANTNKGNRDRNHKLWNMHQLRDIYSICRWCWYVTRYKWKQDLGSFASRTRHGQGTINKPTILCFFTISLKNLIGEKSWKHHLISSCCHH